MKDNGIVVSVEKDLAQVKVSCIQACQECSAHNLCRTPGPAEGILAVRNALEAMPGDEVLIDVPDSRYNRALILFFSVLLGASLMGMTLGWAAGQFILSPYQTSPIGFFLGMAAAILWIFRYFRKTADEHMYPRIVDVINKGEYHG